MNEIAKNAGFKRLTFERQDENNPTSIFKVIYDYVYINILMNTFNLLTEIKMKFDTFGQSGISR